MNRVKYTLLWCFNLIIYCSSIPLFPPEYEIYQAILVHEEHNNEGSDSRQVNVPADIYDIVNHILEVELKDLFNNNDNNNFPNEISNNLEPVDVGNRINVTIPEDNNNLPVNPPSDLNQKPEIPVDINKPPEEIPIEPEDEVTGKPPEDDNDIPSDIFTSEKPTDLPVNKPGDNLPVTKPSEPPMTTTTQSSNHIEEQPTEQPPPETTTILPVTTTEVNNAVTVPELIAPETSPNPTQEEQTTPPENKPEITTTVLPESETQVPVTIPALLEVTTTEESTEGTTEIPTTTEAIPNVDIISREELSQFRDDSRNDKIAEGSSEDKKKYRDLIHVMEASDLIELIRLISVDSTFFKQG